MTDSAKSDIKYPVAKRSSVVFAIVLLAGLLVEIVHQSDFGDLVFGLGLIGFLVSALLALEKKSDVPKIPPNAGLKGTSVIEDIMASDFFGWVVKILVGIFYIALALGVLWGIIAIVKWMWMHS